ncbi:MAG: hypothetical protein HFI77_10685 [Lachnospiraceae bacterium]|nr:hypothetical protein [Lachnospiraceae bacterium]
MSIIPEAIREIQRKVFESTYEDTCFVYEYLPVKEAGTKISRKEETLVHGDIPCKISFKNTNATGEGDGAAEQKTSVKLFLSPDIPIKAGSKIIVMHLGEEAAYKNSGTPGKYPSHQEIDLELFERWA